MKESDTRQKTRPHVRAIAWEGRWRAAYLILILGTFASLYVGATLPQLGPAIIPFKFWAANLVGPAIIFGAAIAMALSVARMGQRLHLKRRRLRRTRSAAIRKIVREISAKFDIRVTPMTSGGPRDGRMSALMIGRHRVLRIGTAALPMAFHRPEDFRFRVAHEIAHLSANDPAREQLVRAAYVSAGILVLVGATSVASSILGSLQVVARNPGAWVTFEPILAFTIMANALSLGIFALNLLLEHRSATRLREFHADAMAGAVVGDVATPFLESADRKSDRHAILWRFFKRHPPPLAREQAIAQEGKVFTADLILFVLQGYLTVTVLEALLQLLFVNASPTLVGPEVRQRHLIDMFATHPTSVLATVLSAAALMALSSALITARLQSSIAAVSTPTVRWRLITLVPILLTGGALMAGASSQAVLWGLKQTGWNFVEYARAYYDGLLVHAFGLIGLWILSFAALLGKTRRPSIVRLALAQLPAGSAVCAGLLVY